MLEIDKTTEQVLTTMDAVKHMYIESDVTMELSGINSLIYDGYVTLLTVLLKKSDDSMIFINHRPSDDDTVLVEVRYREAIHPISDTNELVKTILQYL